MPGRFFNRFHLSDGWVAAILTWLWVACLHPEVFFHPNASLLADGRDAVKNGFTLAWQLVHGPAASWEFKGMAWPYGEHVFYTDGHPLLSWLTGWAFPGLISGEYIVGFMHLLIIASWGFSAWVLVGIFNHWGVKGRWVVLFCSLLPLFHPQVLRWSGHYALAYSVAIPLTWFLLLNWMKRGNKKRAALLGLSILVWLLTHAYLGAICATFAGLMGGIWWVMLGRTKRTWAQVVQITLASTLPLVIYLILLNVSDEHPFRTDQPFGFWDNVTDWGSLLLPCFGPIGALRAGLGWSINAWEGWSYIGIATIAVFIATLIRGVKDRKTAKSLIPLLPASLAALLLFAIAAGEPFNTLDKSWIEHIPLLHQFRAIGRFAWPMGWVMPMAAAFLVSKSRRHHWKWVFVGVFALEAFWMQSEVKHEMELMPNPFGTPSSAMKSLQQLAINSEAVALHPVPWFQMGSESLGRPGTIVGHRTALATSFHTGLPLTAAHLTRSSISESRELAEWMSHPGLAPRIDTGPFESGEDAVIMLLACDSSSTWAQDDWQLWNRAEISPDPDVRFLSLADWLNRDIPSEPEIQPGHLETDLAWDELDQVADSRALSGDGLAKGLSTEYFIIHTLHPDSSWLAQDIEASCWFWHGGAYSGRDALSFEWILQTEWSNGASEWMEKSDVASSGNHQGDWTRAALRFRLDSLPNSLHFFTKGFGQRADTVLADAFRVQSTGLKWHPVGKP